MIWTSLCGKSAEYKGVCVLNANDLSVLGIQYFLQGSCMNASVRGNATNLVFCYLSLRQLYFSWFCLLVYFHF